MVVFTGQKRNHTKKCVELRKAFKPSKCCMGCTIILEFSILMEQDINEAGLGPYVSCTVHLKEVPGQGVIVYIIAPSLA